MLPALSSIVGTQLAVPPVGVHSTLKSLAAPRLPPRAKVAVSAGISRRPLGSSEVTTKHRAALRAGSDMSWQPDDTGMEPLASASGRSSDWQARRGSDFAKAATLVCHVGAAVMFCVIAWALYASTGGVPDNTTQVQWLISNPWGIVSLVDLYVGFTVFSMWIWFREADAIVAAAWTACMMTTGWLGGCLYALIQLKRHKGDWQGFFMGHRAER
ncbi:predicted protein [Micromonas commoda]|uniref:DUF1475 domain-containing protein n=1 Tax=Micromonas commoda (strain RCC299 / NOUM17 / CCMP2709) TaxID=296587 RepID=C1FH90_MICCC|nr:predicted protein [Micromonas commoda]ACO69781.1 predicted protein [Micromonas commoda]|eukprot:XP_002508523.1 predicted protein [Micromonas commoda]